MKSITLVIATYNSVNTLKRTLESVNSLEPVPDVETQVVVVNNNSTDETDKFLNLYNCQFQFLKLFQINQGQNYAKNTLFSEKIKLGDLVIFTDDDVVLPPHFLQKYADAAKQQINFDIFGGTVEALWPSNPPSNMLKGIDVAVAFAVTPAEKGYKTGEVSPTKMHGPNFAIRKRIFDAGFKFNENVGPNGSNYMMGSETELLYRLKNNGFRAFFDSSNAVQHIIREKQLTDDWIASRAHKAGRSLIMHQARQGQKILSSELFGYPRWAVKEKLLLKAKLVLAPKGHVDYYRLLWRYNHIAGYCAEYKKKAFLDFL